LLAKACGNAAHLAALLAVGTPVLGLRERFEGGEWDGGCCGGGDKVFEDGAASERAVWHRRGVFPLGGREEFALRTCILSCHEER
jgi:hypothetical protein